MWFVALLLLGYAVAVLVHYPADLSDLVREQVEVAAKEATTDGDHADRNRVGVVTAFLIASNLVSFCVSAVETTTVAILRLEFNFHWVKSGIFVSSSLLCYPFLDAAYVRVKQSYGNEDIFYSAAAVSAVASLLVALSVAVPTGKYQYIAFSLVCIFVADTVMLCLLQICQGILFGWIHRYAKLEGPFGVKRITTLRVLSRGLVRGVAPWTSRTLLQQASPNVYVLMLLSSISVLVVCVRCGITPFLPHIT